MSTTQEMFEAQQRAAQFNSQGQYTNRPAFVSGVIVGAHTGTVLPTAEETSAMIRILEATIARVQVPFFVNDDLGVFVPDPMADCISAVAAFKAGLAEFKKPNEVKHAAVCGNTGTPATCGCLTATRV